MREEMSGEIVMVNAVVSAHLLGVVTSWRDISSSISRSEMGTLQYRYPQASDQCFNLPSEKHKRWGDEEMILHAGWIVVGLDHRICHERFPLHIFREEGVGDLTCRGEDTCSEDFGFALLFHQSEFDAEPAEPFQVEDVVRVLGGVCRFANEREEFRVVLIHQRRYVAQAVVNHVRFRGEFRMRTMTDELGNGEASVRDVRIKRAIRDGAFSRHQVHVGDLLHLFAEQLELRYLVFADA